jgi:hypothetical protein
MPNIKPLDASCAYRVDRYTDIQAGEILRHVPVTIDGIQDPMRTEVFIGKTTMQTNRGPMELTFEIEARTLQEAFAVWAQSLEAKLEQMQSEATKARILNGVNPQASRLLKS